MPLASGNSLLTIVFTSSSLRLVYYYSVSPASSCQTANSILVAAKQLDTKLEAHTMVYLVKPAVTGVEAFGYIPLHITKLLIGQFLGGELAHAPARCYKITEVIHTLLLFDCANIIRKARSNYTLARYFALRH